MESRIKVDISKDKAMKVMKNAMATKFITNIQTTDY
jgi:hypothetical protein